MDDKEYSEFVMTDTLKSVAQAVGIYVVALGAYWIFIG
jgi:hypothetical protein